MVLAVYKKSKLRWEKSSIRHRLVRHVQAGMAGHDHINQGVDEGAHGISMSLSDRLRNNNLRQVISSLRPLVSETRHRTLRTYARRYLEHMAAERQPLNPNSRVEGAQANSGDQESSRIEQQEPDEEPDGDTNEESRPLLNINREDQSLRRNSWEGRNSVTVAAVPQPVDRAPIHVQEVTESQSSSSQQDPNVVINIDEGQGPYNLSGTEGDIPVPPLPSHQDSSGSEDTGSSSDSTGSSSGEESSNTNRTHRTVSESVSELLNQFPELRSCLSTAWQYCVFLFIVLVKNLFDHLTGLLIITALVIEFVWSNNTVKRSVACQGRRHLRSLVAVVGNIPATIFLICYWFSTERLYYSVLLVPPDVKILTVTDLMWVVIVTDYILKLVTVTIKATLTMLPHTILHYQNRGKYYLVIEMTSQLYRSLAPVQPWFFYLLESYVGAWKILGVFLAATYTVCKGPDIIAKMRNWQKAVVRFVQSMSYGHVPSKKQLAECDGVCPICHDEFNTPTMLQCKHIFCERCVVTWFDRERTCPMCRAQVADDPTWRDGATSHFVQLF